MPTSVQKTFDLLSRTKNNSAVGVLVAALDVADETLQSLAIAALLARGQTVGIVEIIRRSQNLAREGRDLVARKAPLLRQGLREALVSGEAPLRANALELVRQFEEFSELPTLTRLLEIRSSPEREVVEGTIFDLVNRLHEHLQFGSEHEESTGFLRGAQRIRHQMLATLETACHRFHVHRCRQVIEGLLVLCDPENIYLKKLFQECTDEVRGIAAELLYSSKHPGVMSLVVDSLAENYPMPSTHSAFERRTDPEFVCHVLRNWPRHATAFQQKNLRELRTVAWLEPDQRHLALVPAALHRHLIGFLMGTGLPPQQKLAVLEWMVRYGSPEGRLGATDVLKELKDDHVQDVVLESLDSKEPDVQAWATSQLRGWAIPNAMEFLVERIDSPIPEVRQAARSELAGFDVHRVLEIFDQLDPRMRIAVGQLVQKIDPQTTQKLKGEILTAIRSKKIRAARAALVMNLHVEVADALLEMARDSDNLVRRTAAEVLGKVRSRAAIKMLLELTGDGSPRVREAATAALEEIKAVRDSQPNESPTARDEQSTTASVETIP
jgi:hypothetical protein